MKPAAVLVFLTAIEGTLIIKEGTDIHLGRGINLKGHMRYEWRVDGNQKIAVVTSNEDPRYPNTRYKGRIEVDKEWANLTIRKSTVLDSGRYSLIQEDSRGTEYEDTFVVQVIRKYTAPRKEFQNEIEGKINHVST